MSPSDDDVRRLKPKVVRAEVERLLKDALDDRQLRDELERLAPAWAFPGLTWLWGPELYRRNRVMFRPFILSHFGTWEVTGIGKWGPVSTPIKWARDVGARLDAWLEEVDLLDDVELFRKLYPWKIESPQGRGPDVKAWKSDLLARFRAAETRHQRVTVLAKFDLWMTLEEKAALELYAIDPDASRTFILKHLRDALFGSGRKLWTDLRAAADRNNDVELSWELYRRQVPQKQWGQDVLQLADAVQDVDRLNAELERRHPQGWDLKLDRSFVKLVDKRGRDVFPYVIKHLRSVYRSWWGDRHGYTQLVQLAAARGWWDLWSAAVRTCANAHEYNAEVARLLNNDTSSNDAVARRLLMLTGVSREWNFGPFGLAQVQQLSDKTAVLLYQRFPDLVRGPFKMHVSGGWYEPYERLTSAAMKSNDEVLIDYLASRVVTRFVPPHTNGKKMATVVESMSRHYEALKDSTADFNRRAVAVLSQVPAYSIWSYNQLIRTNRLARLLYERSASAYLVDSAGMRDLLEAPEIHVQGLALRSLGVDSDEARQLAAANLDLLQATLLRPLHRKTRALAFRALSNAAADPEAAVVIHRRAREALDLPDKRYPKEQLIGLIGRLLHDWPELRGEAERPIVYGLAEASGAPAS